MKILISRLLKSLLLSLFVLSGLYSQEFRLLESDENHLIFELNFTDKFEIKDILVNGIKLTSISDNQYPIQKPGDPFLPTRSYEIGIPLNSNALVSILDLESEILNDKFVMSTPDSMGQPFDLLNYNQHVYGSNSLFPNKKAIVNSERIFRYLRIASLDVAPIQFNPVQRTLILNKKMVIRVDFELNNTFSELVTPMSDKMTEEFIKSSIINSDNALTFLGKSQPIVDSPQDAYWYNADKNYYKIYLKEKGVYRITFEGLLNAGIQVGNNTPINKLELYNDGILIPIEVFDNNLDGIFGNGDYFQFVGKPPTASPNCNLNIYNLENVYWFSYQSDSTGLYYKKNPGIGGIFTRSYDSSRETVHFEVDSIYERLGYSNSSQVDYWFWGKAAAINGQINQRFEFRFNAFPNFNSARPSVNLKVGLQGMTNTNCGTDHKAYISLTDQPIGDISWDGQSAIVFNKSFEVGDDTVNIYPENLLQVKVLGDVCPSDEIRINWAEFEYWKLNRVTGKYFNFTNYDLSGSNRYVLWEWQGNDMRIYIPDKNKMIHYPTTSNYVTFWDTLSSKTEYFCVSSDKYLEPDSITFDIASDLRNNLNEADYIIINHPNFNSIANQLAEFRSQNFPDENIPNPRIKVVDIQQIYDEFSFGLLDPFALQKFVKYAFENWQSPAPSYIVLIGDMSYDYRSLLQSSRPNFIPSIPYFVYGYGQAASDNMIVAVAGSDNVSPDLAIGRISIETVEEGNIILQKIFNYPADNSKPWKQDVLLLASGLSYDDQRQFGFNQATLDLRNNYVSKRGYHSSIVLNFPDTTKPEQLQYQGGSPEIRAQINEGATLVNYYGHGGGYQWDLTFLNDDIYTLQNGNRLPIILSVTCYTGHFDNQNVFGEQFNKVEGKGSVGFLGSSALTYWNTGVAINNYIFNRIFIQRNFIIGKVVLYAKNQLPPIGANALQVALLTYLGDPILKMALPDAPDFELTSNNLKIEPQNPVIGDSVLVKLNINNWGTTFPDDSVIVELFAETTDTSYSIGTMKIPSFTASDSTSIYWYPSKGGFYTITAKVNEVNPIEEIDHSDNITSNNYVIFNISDPAILKPIDGYSSSDQEIEFVISDVGYYVNKTLYYIIEIDTSLYFSSPIKTSPELLADKSIIRWKVSDLSGNTYFWRTRIYDGSQYGRWSDIRSFTLNNPNYSGYYAHEKILKTFNTYNVKYSDFTKSLVLNTDTLPARPSNLNLIEHFYPDPQLPDSLHLTALTTDGTYLYFGNIWATAGQNQGKSRIYRVGTGNNGTVKGQFYGPFSDFRDSIKNTITYHSDGYIYVAFGKSHKLIRINTNNENIDTINVPTGLLRWDKTNDTDGPVYISSDGNYIYNLTLRDTLGNQKYTLRVLDPSNNWALMHSDKVLDGESFTQGFTGFFVHKNYIYPVEYYRSNYMRRYRIQDGFFEEEWVVMLPASTNFQSYFSWCLDWNNDNIYASVYRASGFIPKFSKFPGNYIDANGSISTKSVGPVDRWNYLKYNLSTPSVSSIFNTTLLGYNSSSRLWDTLSTNIPDSLSLQDLDPDNYSSLKLKFDLSDSTFTQTEPIELENVYFNYKPLSDLYVEEDDIIFESDSVLQGLPIIANIKAKEIGTGPDSLLLEVKQDSTTFAFFVKANPDSISSSVILSIETSKLVFNNILDLSVSRNSKEYFYYNNFFSKSFYIIRDSTNPSFNITFDGRELINGDIISSNPTVVMTLEDNSPLPLTENLFSLQHNNIPLSFYNPADSLKFEYTPFPNSKAVVTWTPKLQDGSHTLSVFAKDSSGNFFNSTAYTYRFSVYNNPDLLQVYNYPNPFTEKTHFTFELRGVVVPQEFKIKVFTVAGRLIRVIDVPPSDLRIGFNTIAWDGRDQDGDEIANGLYFYKIVSKVGDEIKTVTQKLAKVK